ncbi:MAG: beta-phosphoglucomutase family hydrolase [Cytophagales bacterium]|nr:beta-phosphoglucomutase family hydrolase [Cytophagales bacterium]
MKKITVPQGTEGLIFDLDGTLVDSMARHYDAWLQLGEKYGFTFPEEWLFELAGTPNKRIAEILNERLGIDLDPARIDKEEVEIYHRMQKEMNVIEPVVEVVKEYHEKLPMTVGTGSIRLSAEHTLEGANLDGYFSGMVTASEVTCPKPAPETFLKCAELMDVPASKCLVFEDSELGIQAAKDAGMQFVDVRKYYN